jgi:choice-of-anchor B domain-containing protein
MKKVLLLLAFIPNLLASQNYASQNVSLLGHWYNPTQDDEPVYGIKYQGVFGWHQQAGNREYAIIGATDGTFFIDVTNPANPVQCDFVPAAHGNLIWHEIQTYQNYAYIVSDDGGGNTFIIADLSYLPDSVHVVKNDNVLFEQCHTIFVDGDKLYGGSVTTSSNTYYSMAVYDLSVNPASPTFIRALNQDYTSPGTVHDMYVRNDTVYASGGFDALYIFRFNDGSGNNFTQLGSFLTYPEGGYNHSSALTQDGNTLIFMDEVPDGMGIKSLDVSNFGNLTLNQIFRSHQGNTPHNPYIMGNEVLVAANYTDGVQIFNINNPSNVVSTGYFDTDTLVNFPNYTQAYHGCWGAYIELPSGNILASDMQNGLYVLDISQAILLSNQTLAPVQQTVEAFPNPFSNNFFINLTLEKTQIVVYRIYDNTGRVVKEESLELPAGPALLEIEGENLAAGSYTVKIQGTSINASARLMKAN